MKRKFLCVVVSSLLMSSVVYAQSSQNTQARPVEHWVDFKSADTRFAVPQKEAGVVFYRQDQDLNGPSVNIYVDGEYLASLLPNGFRYAQVCPRSQRLNAEFTGVAYDDGYARKAQAGVVYDFPAAAISYFKVVADAAGRPQILRMSAENAKADLKELKAQTHTLSRVGEPANCDTQPVKPVMLQKFTLDAGALFAFNQSDYTSMLPAGKNEITIVANQIKQRGLDINRIEVIGHTDPEGSTAYNQQLSYARALTVKQALVNAGLNANQIQVDGRGEQNLLVTNCRQQHPSNAVARKQCDQANRRVEIMLYGADAHGN